MKKKLLILTAVFVSLLVMLTSCGEKKSEEPDPDQVPDQGLSNPEAVKRAVLVYAVNKSNLSTDFLDDASEMLMAMQNVDARTGRLLVYRTVDDENCGIFEARRNPESGVFEFMPVKQYRRNVTSTHPGRIAEVIEYSLGLFPDAAYDLIFWGHGTSWRPGFSDHQIDVPEVQGYGGEYNPNSYHSEWTDIDDLAEAVPDGKFETIWFDCCYMSGIENIYQFRNKCRWFVGYPTEVWQYGLAYDRMLPHLFEESHDLKKAAGAFFDYYAEKDYPVTVAIMDMKKVEPVAEIANRIMHSGEYGADTAGLLNYSRMSGYPLYDFRQMFSQIAESNLRPDLASDLYAAMQEFVVFHAESDRNFNFKFWDVNDISGISSHRYKGSGSKEEEFYRTLDWYKRVFE